MSNGIDKSIENLKTELRNVSLKLSELRKSGVDTKIAELKVMNIPFKIKLVEETKNYKDIEKINIMLEDVKSEISSTVDANETTTNDSSLNQINILMDKILGALNKNKPNEAKNYYLTSVKIYNELKNNDKKAVFGKLNELGGKLKKEP